MSTIGFAARPGHGGAAEVLDPADQLGRQARLEVRLLAPERLGPARDRTARARPPRAPTRAMRDSSGSNAQRMTTRVAGSRPRVASSATCSRSSGPSSAFGTTAEAAALVERPVPGHVAEGRERDSAVAGVLGPAPHGEHEEPPDPAAAVRAEHVELVEVRLAADQLDQREADHAPRRRARPRGARARSASANSSSVVFSSSAFAATATPRKSSPASRSISGSAASVLGLARARPRSEAHQPSTDAKISGATIVASDSIRNIGVSSSSLPQVIFSVGNAPL